MSCFTIAAADGLAQIFPEAKFVHSVRDGRDSGSSKVSLRQKPHHPTDVSSGIEFWADRLRQAEEGVRGLSDADRERLRVISLDELVFSDREGAYAELCEFLGVSDEPAMREFFEGEMNSDAAHRERWRKGLSADEQAGIVEAVRGDARAPGGRGLPLRPGPAPLIRARTSADVNQVRLRATPSAPEAPVLFTTSNGTGLGHLTRSMAIARRLGDGDEALVMTLSAAAPVVEQMGFPVEYVASYATPGLGQRLPLVAPLSLPPEGRDRRGGRRRRRLRRHPPLRGSARRAAAKTRVVWCRRPLWKAGSSQVPLRRAGAFDAVLEPGELAESLDAGPTVALRASAHRVAPIVLLDRAELLGRTEAAARAWPRSRRARPCSSASARARRCARPTGSRSRRSPGATTSRSQRWNPRSSAPATSPRASSA